MCTNHDPYMNKPIAIEFVQAMNKHLLKKKDRHMTCDQVYQRKMEARAQSHRGQL